MHVVRKTVHPGLDVTLPHSINYSQIKPISSQASVPLFIKKPIHFQGRRIVTNDYSSSYNSPTNKQVYPNQKASDLDSKNRKLCLIDLIGAIVLIIELLIIIIVAVLANKDVIGNNSSNFATNTGKMSC